MGRAIWRGLLAGTAVALAITISATLALLIYAARHMNRARQTLNTKVNTWNT